MDWNASKSHRFQVINTRVGSRATITYMQSSLSLRRYDDLGLGKASIARGGGLAPSLATVRKSKEKNNKIENKINK